LITRSDLNERAVEWGLRDDVVEKDYALGWLLWGIGSEPRLSSAWAFKGGTCLKKCYIETYRFSEDLDFTVLNGGPLEPGDVIPVLKNTLRRVYEESGVDFLAREPVVRMRPGGLSAEGRVYYRGPRNTPEVASIRLDLSASERVVRPTVLRRISHEYPDALPAPATVRCYGFEEVFAEKLRAMGERCRPRDLYDIVNLFRRREFLPHAGLIHSVYVEKCASKGVPVFTLESLENSQFRVEIEGEWRNMLGHQLPALPPFQSFWDVLPDLFAWLDGKLPVEQLPTLQPNEDIESTWAPPPTVWVWGQGVPLEAVRFAAANRLCVELGYQGSKRVIEPYSLRRAKAGHLVLYAVRADSGENRSYRVDRVESINVTNRPFTAKYAVEFSTVGPIGAPPTQRGRSAAYAPKRRFVPGRTTYVIKCLYCDREFARSTPGTVLRPHKVQGGESDCPGRSGYEVDRSFG
jgi:predicted nucleotidyltransferase component of viral defense system